MDLDKAARGVDMGPSALRGWMQTRLKSTGHTVEDIGNVSVRQPEEQHYGEKRAKYLHEIAETCRGLAEMTERSLTEGYFPRTAETFLAVGSVLRCINYFRGQSKRVGYLWLDAPGDMNTPESSRLGLIHGMPLTAIISYGAPELMELLGYKPKVEPRNVVLVGIRDLDAKERRLIKESGVHVFTMRDIDRRGLRGDAARRYLCQRRHRRRGRKPRSGFCRSGRRARRWHSGAWRRDVSRSASGARNDR